MNPEDLEQLARLLDGSDPTSLKNSTDTVFRRAATLGVTGKLTALRPMAAWADHTAPDLRRRAAKVRMQAGDLSGGLLWAGFTPQELAAYRGDAFTPEGLLLANSVAASGDPKAYEFHRKPNESLNDWLDRLRAHALTSIPGLQPFEPAVQYLIGAYGDWRSVTDVTTHVVLQGTQLTKVVLGNSFKKGWGKTWKNWAADTLQRSSNDLIKGRGAALANWTPRIRSLSAPGSWLPGKITARYQQIPGTAGWIGDRTGDYWNKLRTCDFMNTRLRGGLTVNKAIDFLVGSDELAAVHGGETHAGVPVIRAANASLVKVTKDVYDTARAGNAAVPAASRGASLMRGVGVAGKTAGALRGLGIAGSAASTAFSTANVISQGNPVNAFKRSGAAYVADVAEVGFNASLTAAMIAPNPVTFGAAIGTGTVYAGAKVVEHWDDITDGASKATDWAGDEASKVGHGIAHGAKSAAKKLNPLSW